MESVTTTHTRGISNLVSDALETLCSGAWTYDYAVPKLVKRAPGVREVHSVNLHWDDEVATVDRQVILRGLARAFDPDVRVNAEIRARIQQAVATDAPNGCACLDIEEVDVVAQLGLFGEIVYG